MKRNGTVILTGDSLTISDVIDIAENGYGVDLSKDRWDYLKNFRNGLEKQLVTQPEIKIYGTNVGCGDLKDIVLSPHVFENYQERFIKAHNCGTGMPLKEKFVRAIMVLRLNSFAKGMSALRPETCKLMVDMLNRGVTPWVLEEGSVGASGDLVPLAMIAAVMLGLPQAKAYYQGQLLSAPEALSQADLKPTKLGAKEAMGLTNGSSFIAGLAVFAYRDTVNLYNNALISAALSLEAIRGEQDAFSELIIHSRPHAGQLKTGTQIRNLIRNSKRMSTKSQKHLFPGQITGTAEERVQDRYSFRAVPQVHGTLYESIRKFEEILTIEINSATDNPLFTFENGIYSAKSGANFHGQPLAVVVDYLKIALTGVLLITNKRAFAILDKAQSYGLPQDLAADPAGGDTGLMITQYAASARAAESRILSTPASITSISTAANQEDFVSMGSIGILHLNKIILNGEIVVAVELLCALRSLQMTETYLPEHLRSLGEGTQRIASYLTKCLPPVFQDQYLRDDMESMRSEVRNGSIVGLVADLLA
ncbi:aromatic amino acid lyase [bacterium]|nr:aromatic amino acid lyase [candidate division CSSED10-310 bacterium]